MKICIKCNEEKPDFTFTTSNQTKDGLHAYCNDCRTKLNAITHMKTFILLVKEYGGKCSCCGETELVVEKLN